MKPPTVTMHPASTDNRPPPPDSVRIFVVVYGRWNQFFLRWETMTENLESIDAAHRLAEYARKEGDPVYGIAEITATRQEPPHA